MRRDTLLMLLLVCLLGWLAYPYIAPIVDPFIQLLMLH